jgi:predicted MFS family arabinose efflux permease
MAPLKGIAAWYPPERQASMTGWIMVAGTSGALLATLPVEVVLRHVDWRTLFAGFGVLTLVAAAVIAWRIPDLPRAVSTPSFAQQWSGVSHVFTERRFWWIVPVSTLGFGSFTAMQGLWSVPWMMEVEGLTRAEAASVLLAMGGVMLVGFVGLGMLSTPLASRGFHPRHMYLTGWTLNLAGIAAIVLRVPGESLWWCLYAFGAAVNVLAFTLLNEVFPRTLTGRANTAANLTMFAGSFVAQWGIGVIADVARVSAGLSVAEGLRVAFAVVLALTAAAYAWFLAGWKRYAMSAVAAKA